jgi:hypothetical protein
MQKSDSERQERLKMWDACTRLLMPAQNALRKQLGMTEVEFRRVAHTASGKPKEVYIYHALDEIQKAGVAMMHWHEFLSEVDGKSEADPHLDRVILEEVSENQSLRCRKLIELLEGASISWTPTSA